MKKGCNSCTYPAKSELITISFFGADDGENVYQMHKFYAKWDGQFCPNPSQLELINWLDEFKEY
jgi:hypothetical protein